MAEEQLEQLPSWTRVAKLAARDLRREKKRAARERRRLEWACFWTRPIRHAYAPTMCEDGQEHSCCVACGKRYG